MKHISNKPDMKEWNLDSVEKMNCLIVEAVNEAIELSISSDDTFATFAIMTEEDPSSIDPLTVKIHFALTNDLEPVTYSFSLLDALDMFDEEDEDSAKLLAASLRVMAIKLDSVIGNSHG